MTIGLEAGALLVLMFFFFFLKGDSANAVPHDRNYASEFPTFGEIAEVNSIGVQ